MFHHNYWSSFCAPENFCWPFYLSRGKVIPTFIHQQLSCFSCLRCVCFIGRWEKDNSYCKDTVLKESSEFYHGVLEYTDTAVYDFLMGEYQCIAAVVAEWLRRWTWNPLGSPRAGSSPVHSVIFIFWMHFNFFISSAIIVNQVLLSILLLCFCAWKSLCSWTYALL